MNTYSYETINFYGAVLLVQALKFAKIAGSITIHKLIKPNHKAQTYFRKAFIKQTAAVPCFSWARLAYNWGLVKWMENYQKGIKSTILLLKKSSTFLRKQIIPLSIKALNTLHLQQVFYLRTKERNRMLPLRSLRIISSHFEATVNYTNTPLIPVQTFCTNSLLVPHLGILKRFA
ncbi:helix-turn-helix domain-containing protein [Helicobacter salomonis]|uniref:hypothetical protein n=1 Tax=Helicobacter salomonis TaxID=56878 RepID=UPI0018F83192|nr:hypothetical protein [Helicobacter salomonis]